MREDVTLLGHRIKFSRSPTAPREGPHWKVGGRLGLGFQTKCLWPLCRLLGASAPAPLGPCTLWIWWLWTQHVFCSQQSVWELFVLGSDCRVRQGAGAAATENLSGRWPWGRGQGGVQITRPRLHSLCSPRWSVCGGGDCQYWESGGGL